MSNRLKQIVIGLRQALARRAPGPTAQIGGLALATLLIVGMPGSFAGGEEKSGEPRWVVGSLVNLRTQPALDAEVVKRLALNTEVSLLATLADGKFCEVAVTAGGAVEAQGFTACQYLGTEPLSRRRIMLPSLDYEKANPDYNPRQAFWLDPSYEGLVAYGQFLEAENLSDVQRFDVAHARPRDAEFERMKAHLAKGVYGQPAAAYPAWSGLKRAAAAWDSERRQIVGGAMRKYGTDPAQELQTVTNRYPQVRLALELHSLDDAQALGLVNSIELPAAKPSLFERMDELAPPNELAEQVSGRFRAVHTVQTRGRDTGRGEEGVWDIGGVTKSLTRPVIRNVLFRDGALLASATRLKRSYVEWSDADGPMCDGYEDGYAFGDSDPQIWTGYGLGEEAYQQSLQRKPKGSLLFFHTRIALPEQKAGVTTTQQVLDRDATGFVAATTFHFDLNGDGVPDLAVWEGSGQAAGHMDGPTTTDDAHQRLFFANIAGRWHVFGSDSFGYGCGC